MLCSRYARVFALSWGLLSCSAGCTSLVAAGRTGQVLEAQQVRASLGTVTGLTSLRATVSYPPGQPEPEYPRGTYESFSTSRAHAANTLSELFFTLVSSWELQLSYSPFGRCELGPFVSLSRVGGELRCGARPGELGAFDAALSIGIAHQLLSRPHGSEYRAGLDLSWRASRHFTPLLDVYVGYVPWFRGALYDDPSITEWYGLRPVGETRGEWRLSVPLGFAVDWRRDPPRWATPVLVVALVPELTLASKHLAPELDAGRITRVSQFWAIFLTVRCELEILFCTGVDCT